VSGVLALIPARGGSKGIPRKNVRIVAGKPLIAWTIGHALATQTIERTIVSTDDAEIAEIARGLGAEVPFMRPAALAGDDSPDVDAFRHALGWLREHESYEPELVVHLRPTCPVRSVALIDEAVRLLEEHPEADSLRAVSWPVQTPYKMWRRAGPYLEPLLHVDGVPEPYNMPRQSLPEVWWQNGYVDIVRARVVLDRDSMTGERILAFPVTEPVVELDYEENVAEVERLLLEGGAAGPPRHPS
jgi:CMP-N,N'-diacetyllegionaminic acid synthase